MFPLTMQLKAYLVKTFGVKAGLADSVYMNVIRTQLKGKKLTLATIRQYSPKWGEKAGAPNANKGTGTGTRTQPRQQPTQPIDMDAINASIQKAAQDAVKAMNLGNGSPGTGGTSDRPTAAQVFAKATQVRVKSASEQYSTSTKAATYPGRSRKDGTGSINPFAGQPATFMGRTLNHPSDLDKAVSAAWIKWCLHHTHGPQGLPQNLRLDDHSKDLCMYAMHKMAWTGNIGGSEGEAVHRKNLTQLQVKTLLDDTVSGGIEATPIVFDEAIVLTPVLFGEIFPYVNVVNIARGRRIKGAAMTNPTFTSGTSEGAAITPFNTASFVTAFDTPINVASGAMEIGLDFEEDSPVDLGSVILEKYGDKAMEWLDRVIAVGNGYNEPLGIFNTTGLITIQSDNGIGGPPTVSDYEGMMFGVAKQWRNESGAMTAYIASDTSYRRARAIQVAPTDERRVFGMTHADYMLLDRPYKVQNDIPNSKQVFCNLKRYRLYRRLGMTVRVETQGRTLALSNTKLLVVRMRWGGQLENAAAACAITDGQG